jgi:membrane protease subunit (stomatin/prohibitin family)
MALGDQIKSFLKKQFIDVIHWTEPEDGILAWRFPMQDMEIQNGAKLTVRESQAAMFVNEGRCADVFSPGLYTLNTQTLPILTNLMNWDKMFQSPFKSDVYFFSTRQQVAQRWGTAQPVTIRDKDFGAVRVRGYGIYSWHITNPKMFHQKFSGTRELYRVADLEAQLRNTIVGRISDAFAESGVPFLDMAANYIEVGERIKTALGPTFDEMGITVDTLVVENLSLPEELQKRLDERIGMNMIGNMQQYTQFQAAQSLPIAAANEGGGVAGLGVGLGAGIGFAQTMAGAVTGAFQQPGQQPPPQAPPPAGPAAPAGGAPAAPVVDPAAAAAGVAAAAGAAAATKFCQECGKQIARAAKFCPECGKPQA